MAALPRIRQLRRDKTVYALAINTIRLHLEEEDRLARQPHLRQAPDADLRYLQQNIDHWVGMAANHIMQKFHCPLLATMQLLGELQAELKQTIPAAELRQMPLQAALYLPPARLASQE